tara:strand:- start:21 stop:224 length:204 start_codon:yes stop_codon:yes gene_type:complete
MKFNNELELIKVMGWTKSLKLTYILKELKNGKTKDEIFESLRGLIKPKSFQGYINKIETLGDDIKFI